MDLRTNLDIMAGRPDDVSELVVQAMRAAGIPPGEPILLAGHSQGGMVANQIAQDLSLQEQFSISAVLTAGSPVGMPPGDLPPGVLSLHLESGEDLVWALDGIANVDDPQRTTIRGDLADSSHAADRAAALTPVAAHDVAAYARMARDVSALDHPSVTAFEDRLDMLFGGPGTTASTRFYQGVRMP
jgi:pimeloyl-ACP methyl ester carboxylesterase